MTITQTVTIPADHRVFFEFLAPREIPAGKARVELKVTPVVESSVLQSTPKKADVKAETDASATPHTDALLKILSQIGGNIDIDELRMERLAKHIK